jgi:hypothetical protein
MKNETMNNGQDDGAACAGGARCSGGIDRRDFLKLAGAGSLAQLAARMPLLGAPGNPADDDLAAAYK